MPITSVKIKGYNCFTEEYAGFDEFKLINIIIGRNNTGKSHLLKLIESLCTENPKPLRNITHHRISAHLTEEEARNKLGSRIQPHMGDTYHSLYGGNLHKSELTIENKSEAHEKIASGDLTKTLEGSSERARIIFKTTEISFRRMCHEIIENLPLPHNTKTFHHILADRDIASEKPSYDLDLRPNGNGATNIIRSYITQAEDVRTRRPMIQRNLLEALNAIFGPDGHFTGIEVQEHHDLGTWEVHLYEENKGLIPLSSSGSGLKTVILVLLNLLIIPSLQRRPPEHCVYAFEELENNLHPALLRRLLTYIANFAKKHDCPIYLTTHSSVALDHFSREPQAQFIRVTHDGKSARTQTISTYSDHALAIGELGARASDLLQANGIIWVEGPSDAVYLDHWISIYSGGRLQQGRDYACAFYGGALLARISFTDPTLPNEEKLTEMLRINRNAALVCDSDMTSAKARLKERVRNAKNQLESNDSFFWATAGKEIENYLPGTVIQAALGLEKTPRSPGQFEQFFKSNSKTKEGNSYVETILERSTVDKTEMALKSRQSSTREVMEQQLDWKERMQALTDTIDSWNR